MAQGGFAGKASVDDTSDCDHKMSQNESDEGRGQDRVSQRTEGLHEDTHKRVRELGDGDGSSDDMRLKPAGRLGPENLVRRGLWRKYSNPGNIGRRDTNQQKIMRSTNGGTSKREGRDSNEKGGYGREKNEGFSFKAKEANRSFGNDLTNIQEWVPVVDIKKL